MAPARRTSINSNFTRRNSTVSPGQAQYRGGRVSVGRKPPSSAQRPAPRVSSAYSLLPYQRRPRPTSQQKPQEALTPVQKHSLTGHRVIVYPLSYPDLLPTVAAASSIRTGHPVRMPTATVVEKKPTQQQYVVQRVAPRSRITAPMPSVSVVAPQRTAYNGPVRAWHPSPPFRYTPQPRRQSVVVSGATPSAPPQQQLRPTVVATPAASPHTVVTYRRTTSSTTSSPSSSASSTASEAGPKGAEGSKGNGAVSGREVTRQKKRDFMADTNLRLQRDIAGMRTALERGIGTGVDPSSMDVVEQNIVLRRQLRQLGKTVYDFAQKAPDSDVSAKLIEELAYQLHQLYNDLDRAKLSAEEEEQLPPGQDILSALRSVLFPTRARGIPTPYPEEVRREMQFADDLVGRAQRIAAEAADQLWLMEYAIRSALDKVWSQLEQSNGSLDPSLVDQLRKAVQRHAGEVAVTRRELDHVQKQIDHVKSRAWDPKLARTPDCGCQPRRAVLDDDVSHLMQRLREAGDQMREVRDRLFEMELENLALKHEGIPKKKGVAVPGVVSREHLNETLRQQQRLLQEQIRNLEAELRHVPPRGEEVGRGETEAEREPFSAYRAPRARAEEPETEEEARRVRRRVPSPKEVHERRRREQAKAAEEYHAERLGDEKLARLRETLRNELTRHEICLLGLQEEFTKAELLEGNPGWKRFKSHIADRMAQGAQDMKKLVAKIDKRMADVDDLQIPQRLSADLRKMVSTEAVALDPSKLTVKERELLSKMTAQAAELDKTNRAIQRIGAARGR